MTITYHKGNVLESRCNVIFHGCNCFCTMGAGVAKQVRALYPGAYSADAATVRGDARKLGDYTRYTAPDGVVIFNLYTQFDYGRGVRVNYRAVESCFGKLSSWLDKQRSGGRTLTVAGPRIGAGLAGGRWEEIAAIIERTCSNHAIRIYDLD